MKPRIYLIIKDRYFNTAFAPDKPVTKSTMPDPNLQPFKFINCEFHLSLWVWIRDNYKDSIFINEETGFNPISHSRSLI